MSKKPKQDPIETWASSRLSVFLHATSYTVATMAIIIGGAYMLDKYLDTFPTIFIIGLIVGFPITQFIIFKKFRNFGKDKLK